MKILYLILTLLLVLFGCASKSKSRSLEEYYIPSGVDKYFLTDLPDWANFDQRAGCFRESTIRYFNLDALTKSFGYTYPQALQMQASFNEEFQNLKASTKSRTTPMLKEEELLFFKISEKVASKIIFFDPPIFKRVNLIWLDEIFGDQKKETKLKNFLGSSANDEGVPVLVSLCLTRQEVEKKFLDLNAKMITAELFSTYTADGKITTGFKFDLAQFFKPDQKMYFYSQKNLVPAEAFKGTLKLLNY